MSSLDLSDSRISIAHDALLRNAPTRWFLLEYGHGPQVLVLSASGTGDVDELRTHLKDNVCYGVFREQTQHKSLLISINYIPNSVKGVWRARALVHVTAVASKFKVHEVITVSNSDQLSVPALRSTLRLPPRAPQICSSAPLSNLLGSVEQPNINSVQRKPPPDMHSGSVPSSPPRTRSPSPTNELHVHSSTPRIAPSLFTEKQISLKITSPGSVQSIDVSRALDTSQSVSWLTKRKSPLPPPPLKMEGHLQDADQRSVDSDEEPVSAQIGLIPDSKSVTSLHIPDSAPSAVPPPSSLFHSVDSGVPTRRVTEAPSHLVDGLPPASLSSPPTKPATAEDTNDDPVRNRTSTKDQGGFSAPKKPFSRFQDRASSPADAEEERKLVVLEEERRRRAMERARREKEIREEEEARQREFEERKEREKKRRLENARKSEERRIEQKRQQEEDEARKKDEKERKEADLREKRSRIKQRFERQAGMDLLSGFITLESSGSWKRRYYRLSTEDWIFFKNDEETTMPIHAIELSRIRALREWHEGYEELEAIPYSFAVEFEDDAPCLFFADSAEDKEILLGLLNQAAGL